MGDGEQQEGQIWEAAMEAAHYKLDNLIGIVDCNGLQIDGTYYSSSFLNTSAGGNTGGVASSTTITFTADGQFSTDNYAGFAGSGPDGGGTASSQGSGSGTYTISGDTLDLLFSDGTDVKLTFFVYPRYENGAHPGFLIVNCGAFSPRT